MGARTKNPQMGRSILRTGSLSGSANNRCRCSTAVEHRHLLLAEPLKLPVLNIDLPIWGFFVLAPILFVLFHFYVLLQVLLLARTASSYNSALDSAVRSPTANATMRQRLANTLFAQIFAGSPRERDGWLGWLLKA